MRTLLWILGFLLFVGFLLYLYFSLYPRRTPLFGSAQPETTGPRTLPERYEEVKYYNNQYFGGDGAGGIGYFTRPFGINYRGTAGPPSYTEGRNQLTYSAGRNNLNYREGFNRLNYQGSRGEPDYYVRPFGIGYSYAPAYDYGYTPSCYDPCR